MVGQLIERREVTLPDIFADLLGYQFKAGHIPNVISYAESHRVYFIFFSSEALCVTKIYLFILKIRGLLSR